ncbi:MAG: hypothetical protein A3I29_00360 [Candidatus Magasanikbacteria bacterium RIFCSPLOWO2_02_FULL_44_11]|uniref:DUF4878 domain-containing protein n=1 Tax=Candidatus Magasanikbacteria bacterium RIFCSPLOWO2_02_FULL_44_11 TaxID=1798689 RepID=A0A1F6NAR8_9BACT|nr:MAG: hypothetical protein A3I29_00360 [Candidatus Magasanikbacteria bacterium RIFCSPLOWO2_02_FULL_44_11]
MQKNWRVLGGVGVVAVLCVMGYFFITYGSYKHWKFSRLLKSVQSVEEIKSDQDLKDADKDVSGGFTPDETLSFYIKALENRDYAVASSYFIGDKQAIEFTNFLSADVYTLDEYLQLIKKPYLGTYSDDKMFYTARYELPGPDFFARFRKYPNKRWKLIEI